ncbi:MAG: GAF domain-containing protein, partial [Caldimonas sp.]
MRTLRRPFERLVNIGLRLNELRSERELHAFLIDKALELSGAQRVLLVLDTDHGLRIAGSMLPRGEDPVELLNAVEAWLVESRRTRSASLRHGPHGAAAIDQRSCLVAPLIAQGELLGYLYADVEGASGRFGDADRELLALLAAQAAVALANARFIASLGTEVAQRAVEARSAQAQADRRASELSVIHSIQQGAAEELSFQAIVDRVGDKLRELFDTGDIHIVYADSEGVVETPYAYQHGERVQIAATRPNREGPMYKTLVAGRPVVANSAADMAAFGLKRIAGTDQSLSTAMVPFFSAKRLGVISLQSFEREGAFGEAEVSLLQTIAIGLGVALENVRLFAETQEALQHQTATADILKVIASSPADAQPVFDAIVASLLKLLGTQFAAVQLLAEGMIEMRAVGGKDGFERLADSFPRPLDGTNIGGLVMLTKKTTQFLALDDPEAPPATQRFGRELGFNSVLFTPMIRDGRVIGAIGTAHPDARVFDERQIALIRSFADQAVIAIENVRLFNDTKEALERQKASAEVLSVISNSVSDSAPVFEAIVQSCRRLFGGKAVALAMPKRGMIEAVAFASDSSETKAGGFLQPWPLDRDSGAGACILDSRLIVVTDTVEAQSRFKRMKQLALALGYHSALFVPMLRDGQAIGALAILRAAAGEFEAHDVALAQTFADQAVIAIENARLFNALEDRNSELTESLAQQTATGEILRVISSSPTDIQPVLDAVSVSAARLCGATDALILSVEGGMLRRVAHFGTVASVTGVRPVTRDTPSGRAIVERRPIHIHDLVEEFARGDYLEARTLQERTGIRTVLAVPLMRDDTALGVITVRRVEVRPFTDTHIKLVTTFASQAVIAIENVRLFNETKDALERQTATAEILRVISGSPTDVQPVFDAIAERARLLCGALVGATTRFDGDLLHLVGYHGPSLQGEAAMRAAFPMKPGRGSINARAILAKAPAQIADVDLDPEYQVTQAARQSGFRSG